MTGSCFVSTTIPISKLGQVPVTIELRSFNGRFFEAVCKLPGALSNSEYRVARVLQDKLVRGRVYCTVTCPQDSQVFLKVVPSLSAVRGYLDAVGSIKKECDVQGELSMAQLVALPGVFSSEPYAMSDTDEEAMLACIEQAAEQLLATRVKEGVRLERDMNTIFAACKSMMEQVNVHFQAYMNEQKNKLKELTALGDQIDDQTKQDRDDLFAMINKIDIHEEITRFNSHLESLVQFLKAEQVDKGKRLDFIIQELLRETNTSMAKCSHFSISSRCIDIKVELEKAREQIQNIV